MDHSTTEPDHRSTLAIGVLHAVDVLGGLHALLLHPCLDGLAQARSIDEAGITAEFCHRLLNLCLILCLATTILRHLRKRRVGHLCHQHTRGKAVLDVVLLETLAKGAVGAQHRPVIGHAYHSRLSLVGVVVLTPLAVVEAHAVDVVLRTPRAGTIRLPQRVQLLAERVQAMAVGILEALQQRRATHGDGHHANQHLRVVGSLLVGLAVLLALLPLLLAAAGNGILLVQLPFPHVHRQLAHALA